MGIYRFPKLPSRHNNFCFVWVNGGAAEVKKFLLFTFFIVALYFSLSGGVPVSQCSSEMYVLLSMHVPVHTYIYRYINILFYISV